MIAYRLFLLTLFLVVLLYSGYGLLAALFVFFITTVTTYICYSLKTQLKVERLVNFILKFGISLPRSNEERKHPKFERIKSFPKPIADILQKIINSIINSFVKTWYSYIGPGEEDFIKEVEFILENVILEVYNQLEHVDLKNLTAVLVRMFQRHIHLFDECRSIINKKYPGINKQDFTVCITELYEAAVNKHIATLNKSAEIDYIRTLLDIILYKFAPKDAFLCESGRFMLREVLAIQLVEPLIQEFIDPHVLNEIVNVILEPSLPLSVIQQRWNEAFLQVEKDTSLCHEIEYNKKKETDNESVCEGTPLLETSEEHSTPVYSALEHEDDDLSGSNIIRFNKFDERSSAPVYGSKSVRDHEKKALNKYTDSSSSLRDDLDIQSLVSLDPIASSWGVCPTSSSEVFLGKSFLDMPRNQDDISEQVKSKLRSLSEIVASPSLFCLDRNGYSKHSNTKHKSKRKTKSQQNKNTSFSSVPEKVAPENRPSLSEIYQFQQFESHKSGEEGVFYDVAPSCPTCMEMSFFASPFQNKSNGFFFNADKKIKGNEHDCGLKTQHFFYPALVEKKKLTSDSIEKDSFVSCSNYQDEEQESSKESEKKTVAISMQGFDVVSSLSDTNSSSDTTGSSSETTQSIKKSAKFFDQLEKNDDQVLAHSVRSVSASSFRSVYENSLSINHEKVKGRKSFKKKTKSVVFRLFKKDLIQNSKHNNIKKFHLSNDSKVSNDFISKDKVENKEATHIPRIYKNLKAIKKNEIDNQKFESSSVSTTRTKFHSIPENESDKIEIERDSFMGNFVEEIAHEINEDDIFFEEDANSQHYLPCPENVDPLSKVITVTEKGCDVLSIKSARSAKSNESKVSSDKSSEKLVTNSKERMMKKETYIPIFEGQVIMPHPSKLPAAWLYPIQMISIPSTEIAFEKGWEPGINKYTLYNIHYDIRIWPDLYQKHLNHQATDLHIGDNAMPLIREIKRRYREFLYLHNRLTHGPMAKHMKGILRPNRRYAMPFGRMDPDVIEGRRKILESYLVSLVSRPEMCNSREFKDFLGSEDHDEVSVLKTKVFKKQLYQSQLNKVTSIKPDEHNLEVHKAEKMGMKESPYFIHGYDVPRMFGYADEDDLPHFIIGTDEPDKVKKPTECQLGRRTSADGSENPQLGCYECVLRDPVAKLPNGKSFFDTNIHSIHIAAKFSEQLAADLHESNLARAIAREKDLFESSWPLTNALLSILCQFLKKYPSFLTFERVQQSVLFSVGGVIEWFLGRQLDEVIIKERCYKYLCDLYNLIWDKEGILLKRKPDPTLQQREETRVKLLNSLIDIIPSFLSFTVGKNNIEKCCEDLLQTIQYPKINKHIIYSGIELILMELIPELRHNFINYVSTATSGR